jgi:hypothetical protein
MRLPNSLLAPGRRFTGLGAPAGVRAAFHRHLGTSPQEYRTLFRHRTTAANLSSRKRLTRSQLGV